jgi:hypothetical protein
MRSPRRSSRTTPEVGISISAGKVLWLSLCLIHLCPGPFTGGHGRLPALVRGVHSNPLRCRRSWKFPRSDR